MKKYEPYRNIRKGAVIFGLTLPPIRANDAFDNRIPIGDHFLLQSGCDY